MTFIVAPAAAVLWVVEPGGSLADTLSGAGAECRRPSTAGSRSVEGARRRAPNRYRECDTVSLSGRTHGAEDQDSEAAGLVLPRLDVRADRRRAADRARADRPGRRGRPAAR